MKKNVKKLASDHVEWILGILRPLLISYFEHGYKHGYVSRRTKKTGGAK